MPPPLSWSFPPFRLDPATGSLWRDEQLVPLPPKPCAVLAALVAQAGQVVTKEALFDAVWPETAVTDGVLKGAIRQVRRALGEWRGTALYIATVHRRGYRFIAPVTPVEGPVSGPTPESASAATGPLSPSAALVVSPSPLVVGREAEVAQLHEWWTTARRGTRQIGFITGEAGIGKTTLVDVFVAQVACTEAVWTARGQCIEHYGAGEAYLPLLGALGQLGRGPDGASLVALFHQYAPSWLVHLPALVPEADFEGLQRRAGGTTRERMLRELAEAMEALTARRPVVLVLEDLHWSDGSTLDWLAYMARRRARARLLVLGTYRPAEAVVHAHPVRRVTQELQVQGQGVELPLRYLAETGVATYLTQRFAASTLPAGLAQVLHQRTEGNPLFLVAVVDELGRRGVLREGRAGWELVEGVEAAVVGVPESLRQFIDQQFEQLSPSEQALLEAASVAGAEFAAAAVAAGIEQAVEAVEALCATLTRRGQLVQVRGAADWPDGTVTACYGFLHALYREIIYDRVPVSRRMRWHRQIGLRLETGYGPRARQVAAELAEHFVRGRDTGRAVAYLRQAGEQAVQRSAHQEALQHLSQGLDLLATLPDTPQRAQQELDLRLALGPVLMATKGYAAPEVEQTYGWARVLCGQVGETPQLLPALRGLWVFYLSRGALSTARGLGEQLLNLAQREATPTPLLEAHAVLGATLFHLGEYAAARAHLEQGIALTDSAQQQALALRHSLSPGVTCLAYAALTLWCLGYPEQAVQRSQEALTLAQVLAHPHTLTYAQHWAAQLHHLRREAPAVQVQAEAFLTLATAHGFPLWMGVGTFWRGWALAMQGQGKVGLAQMHQGMAAVLATGQTLSRPLYLVQLAEAAGYADQVEAGLRLLAEALAAFEESGRGDRLAEVYRLQGELLRNAECGMQHVTLTAEECFQQALAIARRQQAKSWELRAALSLSRLWQQQGRREDAHQLLAEVYTWFTEGFDTADLQEAKELLDELT